MKNQLTVFEKAGHKVQTTIVDGEVWFVAVDVCKLFDLQNATVSISSLDDDEKAVLNIFRSGQMRAVNVINEAGLYRLATLSRKPETKNFRKWIAKEVIPSIRKQGKYEVKEMTKIEWIETCLQIEKEKLEIQEQLTLAAPKIAGYEALMDSTGYLAVGAVGNILNIGRNILFAKLRAMGILMDNNRPYQKFITAKWFVVKTIVVNGLNKTQTFVTPKGLDNIRKELV